MDATRCACGFVLDGAVSHAYNEEAFRHLLTLERRRAARANQPVVLLVVAIRRRAGHRLAVTPAVAATIFEGLHHSLRDVDFVGWLREPHLAAAVLSQGTALVPADAGRQIGDRIVQGLRAHLPATIAHLLTIRVLQLRPSGPRTT